MMISYHPLVKKIIGLLQENNFWYETFEHEPVRTSEEAAKIRHGYNLHQGAKALLIRIKISGGAKKFVMVVIPGDMRFDNIKVKEQLGAKEIRFATAGETSQLTDGVEFGGVPPFGNVFGLEVFVDHSVLQNEKIIFNAGDRRFSIAIFSKDYITLVNPKVVEII